MKRDLNRNVECDCGEVFINYKRRCPNCGNINPYARYQHRSKVVAITGFIFFVIISATYLLSLIRPGGAFYIVNNSAEDGSVKEVVQYIKDNVKDSESYEGIYWSKVMDMGFKHSTPHRYFVKHQYRIKNNFGSYITENHIFYIDDAGKIIDVRESLE